MNANLVYNFQMRFKKQIITLIFVILFIFSFVSCGKNSRTIPKLNYKSIDSTQKPDQNKFSDFKFGNEIRQMYDYSIVDEYISPDKNNKNSKLNNYLAHPDSIICKDGSILTTYVKGHGRGEILMSRSYDNGSTWIREQDLPKTFSKSEETPTLYELDFKMHPKYKNEIKTVLISGRPGWQQFIKHGEGFSCSLGDENGKNWTEFEHFFSPLAQRKKYKEMTGKWNPIVAMASLIQLKDPNTNQFINKWAGFFHDYSFKIYKTILSFNDNGEMEWTDPEPVFNKQRRIESLAGLCEPCVFRDPKSNEIMILMRAQNRKTQSFFAISTDECITWNNLTETSSHITGDRHKITVDKKTGLLCMTFRDISYYGNNPNPKNQFSRGTMLWIGNYSDIKERKPGLLLLKLQHSYSKNQNKEKDYTTADSDTGYCGIVCTTNGHVVVTTYGKFNCKTKNSIIISKILNIKKLLEYFKD